MKPIDRPTSRLGALFLPLAGLALLTTAATVAGQSLKAAHGELLVPSAEGRFFIQRSDGHRVELPLGKSARVSDLRSVPEGWYVAAVARGGEGPTLEILRGRGSEIEGMGSPVVEPAAELMQPVFLADRGGIHGLVWLAGEAHDRMAVRAARWLGDRWSPAETVSPPGAGTQIALSTAALADGSWLLVWAAFDGRDDEILWSRWSNGAWSRPRPVAADNAVPDITPHLFGTAGGALVAWSRYDGNDYRVNVARFDGEAFSEPRVVGPRGSTAPTFSEAAAPYLIYHRADPRAWGVIELDAAGTPLRQALVESTEPQRPVLAAVSEKAVTLEWVSLEKAMVSAPLPWTAP